MGTGTLRRFRAAERGAALVEATLLLPLLVMLVFGIVEYSSAYHDSSVASDAARSGGRVASAQARMAFYATNTAAAAATALDGVPADAPEELWIYKANSQGYPGTGTSFNVCSTDCIKYVWDASTRAFDTSNPQGDGWPAAMHQAGCADNVFDSVGVHVKVHHNFITPLFGATIDLREHAVFRFEPVSSALCNA